MNLKVNLNMFQFNIHVCAIIESMNLRVPEKNLRKETMNNYANKNI